jgi:teichuronic acid exporter
VDNLTYSIGRVTFPVFSTIQEDKARLKRSVRKALSTLALVNFPVMICLAVAAKPLVLVLLTAKWLPCVPYLQLLCAVGILYPLHAINLNVLKAQGRSDLFFRLEVLKKMLVTIAVCITWRWGIMAMIYGQIATSIIAYYMNSYYTGRLLSYPVIEQLKDFIPILSLASMMGIGIYLIGYLPFPGDLSLLTAQLATGMVLYVCLCSLFNISSFIEIRSIFKSKLQLILHRPGGDYFDIISGH